MFGTIRVQMRQIAVERWRVAGAIRSLVNARGLHESLLVPVLMYGRESNM